MAKKIKPIPESCYLRSTKEKCWRFWENPNDGKNKPKHYADSDHIERSIFLYSIFEKYNIDKEDNILELGCNVGRNLNYLFGMGYKNLSGVEINKNAILYGSETYPFLDVTFYNYPIEEIITVFEDNQFDVVYSMAVLMHVHVDSEWIFDEIKRISNKYIITIEDQIRDYKKIFESGGFKQIGEYRCEEYMMSKKYITRVFEKI